ncbi:VOC family protein [Nostoc sp. CENA67]|uniref:VOC family protein n=1 Tax=Amazonocrinis nigriterrae CENA67 TaxID=2794033 RepID=A0A8J7HPZ0_9NOST|nr:VOC family protein [Amazonocrinis nigriterrae]MBH8561558.1 VOC family protein [Amazonocrinis nigriterrae CENA67]
MIRITRLNHAVLYVRDVERSSQFYQSIFGFTEVAAVPGRMAFLRAINSNNHHDLGLISLGSQAPSPPLGAIGLYHLGWEVETIEELSTAAQLLQKLGLLRGASDHGASKSLYAQDPDGHQFEILWQVPKEVWGQLENQVFVAPLNLEQELKHYSSLT